MRITPIGNNNKINFGYDKELNGRLKARLQQSGDLPVINVLKRANNECNYVEGQILKLEGKDRVFTDENEAQINFLLDYFMDIKTFLCTSVDRLFPDLNFMKTECDWYETESSNLSDIEGESDDNGPKRAYVWRDMMSDGLRLEIENMTSYATDEDGETDYDDECGETSDKYKKYLKEQKKLHTGKKGSSDEIDNDLVDKFVPTQSSPQSLDDVVGLDKIRDDIKELIIFPIEHPDEAQQRKLDYDIDIPHFIVFHGPPGCGKTMLAQAIAQETGCDMYSLDLSKIGASYVNETAKNVGKSFEYVKKQAEKSDKPVILFLDEMDSILAKRINDSSGGSREDNKTVNALLTLTAEAKEKGIIIIGATNMFDIIDPAAKRRIDLNAYVGLPNKEEIVKLLKMRLNKFEKGKTLAQDDEALKDLSKDLSGHSPSNIVNIVKASAKIAYKEKRDLIKEDVQQAIKEGSWEKIKEREYMPKDKQASKIGFM
ncbi:ATP-binding protein [bacterium]|nr:ATP-binding protein [bacterium]